MVDGVLRIVARGMIFPSPPPRINGIGRQIDLFSNSEPFFI